MKFVDFDGNDYGVRIDVGSRSITIEAHFLTSSGSATAFREYGSGKWNAQSGNYVFVASGLKALRKGNASVYEININITSEIRGDADQQGRYQSDRDQIVYQDQTGTLNSFDVEIDGFIENQAGGTGNDQVDMKKGRENSDITTHEVNHTMGIDHTDKGGSQPPHGGGSVARSQISETLNGVGIGGNTSDRNRRSGVGDGMLLNNSSNAGLENGKVISVRRYERVLSRIERRNDRLDQ